MSTRNRPKWKLFCGALGVNVVLTVVAAATVLFLNEGLVPEIAHAAGATTADSSVGWALLAAALSTGLSTIAAGYAVAVSASAALGALAENPDIFGRALIFVGLAEGIAIYGLIVSILILGKV